MKYNRLTFIEEVLVKDSRGRNARYWRCKCDCGNEVLTHRRKVITGHTKSCGCLQREIASTGKHVKHKASRSPLYVRYTQLKQRCNNPNHKSYSYYGGRGIKLCAEWEADYSKFAEWANANGYTEGLQLDRIDNSKGYSPENCKWVTKKTNMRNTRHNKFVGDELLTDFMQRITTTYNMTKGCFYDRYYKLLKRGIEINEYNIVNYLSITR